MLQQPVRGDYVMAEAEQQSQVVYLMIRADLRAETSKATFHNKWKAKCSFISTAAAWCESNVQPFT